MCLDQIEPSSYEGVGVPKTGRETLAVDVLWNIPPRTTEQDACFVSYSAADVGGTNVFVHRSAFCLKTLKCLVVRIVNVRQY